MIARARTVEAITREAARIDSVRKSDLRRGDRVLIATENSVYAIGVVEDSTYSITGGWFDRQGLSPAAVSIAGCTWGGSVIQRDIVAAPGLRLEFGNRVLTSRILQVRLIRRELLDGPAAEPLSSTIH